MIRIFYHMTYTQTSFNSIQSHALGFSHRNYLFVCFLRMPFFWVESHFILLGVSLRETYKHYWARWVDVQYYLIGQLPCVRVCLHDFLCIYLYALLSFCPSVCLPTCPLYLTDLVSYHQQSLPPSNRFIAGPHLPESPSEYLSSNFTAHYFFMSSEE